MSDAESLVEQAYQGVLRLLTGREVTGREDLRDADLAKALGVSRTPVRMALTRLEAEGLLHREAGRGWSRRPLTVGDIDEIFHLKEVLHAYAAYRAAEAITPASEAALLSTMSEMEQAVSERNRAAEIAADQRFHDLILELAGNQRLADIERQLNTQWYPLRKGLIAMQGGMKISCEEHRRIADAIVAHNPELAAECATRHHRRVRNSLIHILQEVLSPVQGS